MRAVLALVLCGLCAVTYAHASSTELEAAAAAEAEALASVAGPLNFRDWFGVELDETSPSARVRAAARAAERVDDPAAFLRAYRHHLLTGEDPAMLSARRNAAHDLAPKARFRSRRTSAGANAHAHVSAQAQAEAEFRARSRRIGELLYGKQKAGSHAKSSARGGDAHSICLVAQKHYKLVITDEGKTVLPSRAAPNANALEQRILGDSNWKGGSSVWSSWSWVPYFGGEEAARIRHLITHVAEAFLYRLAHLAGGVDDAQLCETAAIEVAVFAVATTHDPPGGATADFAFGIEEEFHDIELQTQPINANALDNVAPILRGNTQCPAPRSFDYFRVTPDHGPIGGIVEVITGPMPITWANRNVHRAVSNTFYAAIPKSATPNTQASTGAWTALSTVRGTYNGAVNAAAGNANFQTAYPRSAEAWEVRHVVMTTAQRQRVMPSGGALHGRAIADTDMGASIQVNFECSLCSVAQSAGFLAQWNLGPAASQPVLVAARAAAVAHIALNTDFPTAQYNALSNRHKCELKGLLTIVYLHAMYWRVSAVATATRNERIAHHNSGLPKPVLSAAAQHVNADLWWGFSTNKNFFPVMIKTGIHSIVSKLPLPVADMVWKFHVAVQATAAGSGGRRAITTPMHTALMTAMNAAGVSFYANRATYAFDVNGDYFSGTLPWLGNALKNAGVNDGAGSVGWTPTSPIGDRAPPAFVWHGPGGALDTAVVFVAEGRVTRSPLNQAFTEELYGVLGATALLAAPNAQAEVTNLNTQVATPPV